MIANLNLDDCNFLLREVLILLLNSQGDCGQFEISMWMKEHHIKNKITMILKFWNGTVLSYKMYDYLYKKNLLLGKSYKKKPKNSHFWTLVFK